MPSVSELAAEGRRIIKALGGLQHLDIFASDMPLLATLLARVPADRTQEYFRRDKRTGQINIRSRKLRGIKRVALLKELAANNAEVRLKGDHYLVVPATWFEELLAKHYGGPVALDDRTRDGEALAA